jgi:hypothetical protein
LPLRPERVLRLGPFPVPQAGSVDVATIVDQPAVALYCGRAQAVNHRFSLNADNAGAVVALCRQLEGLPLAIELAAAHAASVPAAEVLSPTCAVLAARCSSVTPYPTSRSRSTSRGSSGPQSSRQAAPDSSSEQKQHAERAQSTVPSAPYRRI